MTSVFIGTICLAGSSFALEKYQKDIMIWFAQRDYIILGMGSEGFDIVEIPWNKEIFDAQQNFILQVVDLVIKKTNWQYLSYNPNDLVFSFLADFKLMIADFGIECIEIDKQIEIFNFDDTINQYDKCQKHNIYKHFQGCVICNNE